MKNLQMATAG